MSTRTSSGCSPAGGSSKTNGARSSDLPGSWASLRRGAGQRRCGLAEGEVPQSYVLERLQVRADLAHIGHVGKGFGDGEGEQIGKAESAFAGRRGTEMLVRVGGVAAPAALCAGDLD